MAMQAQELFDAVAAHLLKQNAQALDDDSCVYRGPNGLRCAVGGVLPDDLYSPKMEGTAASCLLNIEAVANYFGEDNGNLLDALQAVHDDHQPSTWPEHLTRVAETYGLTFTPPAPAA